MTTQQTELALTDLRTDAEEDPQRLLAETLRHMEKARRILAPRAKKTRMGLGVQDFEKVLGALRQVQVERVVATLQAQHDALVKQRDAAFKRRREDLARSARAAGWAVRRLKFYDHVGCFQVLYRRERVTVKLGSEELRSMDEVDGSRLFIRLQQEKERLDGFPFDRSRFYEALKESIGLARLQHKHRNGRVLIRDLYPRMVLVLQSRDPRFVRRPGKGSFTDYQMAQFVYDLARFGRDGWKAGQERLSNQPPNMASIAKGDTVTLPSLEGDGGKGPQLCAIYIQRL